MSAALAHPTMGPYTVQDWLNEDPPADGSKRELILGRFRASPTAAGEHNVVGSELYQLFKSALRLARCSDFHASSQLNAKLSTARRTAVIPDAAILNTRVRGVVFEPDQIELVAEVWSPGNRQRERAEKFEAYALARIPYFWTVDMNGPVVKAYKLRGGTYQLAETLRGGTTGTITAAPVPVTFDPLDLLPE